MSEETIVAVYDTAAQAEAAGDALEDAGIPAGAISMHAGSATSSSLAAEPVQEEGFWASLFGGTPDHDTTVYDRSLQAGSTVVTVKVADAHVASVLKILESHHPIDIDERANSYGLAQAATGQPVATAMPATSATDRTAAKGDTLQLSEERLAIGKRVVNRGGTRIRRFVVETPVEETVTLHEERVVLERHPVTDGRPVTAEFSDKTIEMTETAEEAIVSKTARVVEEIGLRKEVSDRVETVRDSVRKEDVEIVQVPGEAATTAATGPTRLVPSR